MILSNISSLFLFLFVFCQCRREQVVEQQRMYCIHYKNAKQRVVIYFGMQSNKKKQLKHFSCGILKILFFCFFTFSIFFFDFVLQGDLVQLKEMPTGASSELKAKAMDHLVMAHGLRHENINPLIGKQDWKKSHF